MARRERLANDAESTLATTISDSATSFDVDDASDFPTEGDFRIVVDNEIMIVTAVSSNTFTVTRGAESTAAANHVAGSQVAQILTVSGLQNYIKEVADPYVVSRPPYRIQDTNGDILDDTDFSSFGAFTGATASSSGGVVTITQTPQGSEVVAPLVRTAPSTPYTIECCIAGFFAAADTTDGPIIGVCFAESGTGKLVILRWRPSATAQMGVDFYTNVTTFSSTPGNDWEYQQAASVPLWAKLADNGTNISIELSIDGVNYVQVYDALRGAHFTTGPDRVGFFVDAINSEYDAYVNLLAWDGE